MLESTGKESKIVDLEIEQLQLKIQECLDKTASCEIIQRELVSVLHGHGVFSLVRF